MYVGMVTAWERTFTLADVQLFGQLSGDLGQHHVQPDEQGRVMVQGLLTATLPTRIGGEISFIARTVSFEFLRPVFTGDTVRCENTIRRIEPQGERTWMVVTFACRNQQGKEVLTGQVEGFVRTPVAPEDTEGERTWQKL